MGLKVGDSTFGRQVLTFVQKLTELVRDLPKTVLVYSLQASVQESFGNEGLLSALDKLVSRIDAKKEPVSGDELTSKGRDTANEVSAAIRRLYDYVLLPLPDPSEIGRSQNFQLNSLRLL